MVRKEKIFLIQLVPFNRLGAFLLLFLPIVFLIGCGNDIKTVNSMTGIQSGPTMTAKNLEVLFSQNGKLQAKLKGPLMNKYGGEQPYLEFPKGFVIEMFDSLKKPVTIISGKYGKRDELMRIMDAKGDVVVRNIVEGKQLNTEHLTWDENRQLIFSDVQVKITTPDKVLYGSGIKANETFTWYQIPNVSATMTVNQDSI